ncbi:50S ribosomal protein L4 [Methermicoccus shengliensis]|uniref:Large ribosomal subunit protein uL4 n=1 Tax=Methermicoccus shengliensis TaxID=660064 RepID=A0A832RS91_9EURY|nr:50S ribosomal protein L4 [Methermicoccus shengliensis]KUK05117.1 MAG: 50S ribosomal protein L4 [Euryarchaeota archaeon 55_53]KUK30683.1 MAG: 50S ribosomal protein L4 [Methanosarcinales archeaon 56_1174]MDI3488433.1 large subunit ribosomal protein L4e [Methanosarcinales archaeon]MDN5294648.1 large subunit ribosomal protein L4e [Methanosarcinales archaeon]HIH69358.1 50S ribosomal protein L4 [Methermicoccus shengliensis]
MHVSVVGADGVKVDEMEVSLFDVPYRPDVIKRAVLAAQANRLQPYGPRLYAGMESSARSWGPGRGVSRVPRLVNSSRAAIVPQAKGGRKAHPPKPYADYSEKVNKKERRLAMRSAIAATASPELVAARGHRFSCTLPLVYEDSIGEIAHTKDVVALLSKMGVYEDVERAKLGISIRAGKGKMRGRRYKVPKSVLIVTPSRASIERAARNLPGVDVVDARGLNVEYLAPGTHAGRLTVWTKGALSMLEEWLW